MVSVRVQASSTRRRREREDEFTGKILVPSVVQLAGYPRAGDFIEDSMGNNYPVHSITWLLGLDVPPIVEVD
jgi:hypothetical protein